MCILMWVCFDMFTYFYDDRELYLRLGQNSFDIYNSIKCIDPIA